MNFRSITSVISSITLFGTIMTATVTVSAAENTVYDTLTGWEATTKSAIILEVTNDDPDCITLGITDHEGLWPVNIEYGSIHNGSTDGSDTEPARRAAGTRIATQNVRFYNDDSINNSIIEYIGAAYDGFNNIAPVASIEHSFLTGDLTITVGDNSKTVDYTEDEWYTLTVTAEYSETNAVVTIDIPEIEGAHVSGTTENYDINTFATACTNAGIGLWFAMDSKNESIGTLADQGATAEAVCEGDLADREGASIWTAVIQNNTGYTLTRAAATSTTTEELGSLKASAEGPLSINLVNGATAYVTVIVNKAKEDLAKVEITLK